VGDQLRRAPEQTCWKNQVKAWNCSKNGAGAELGEWERSRKRTDVLGAKELFDKARSGDHYGASERPKRDSIFENNLSKKFSGGLLGRNNKQERGPDGK